MATLNFKGKTFVQNHHLAVKYHQLVPKKNKSLTKKVSLNDNLIIHGDNLLALKALLPTYAGKVKCIYIDPPYNIGNENWVYNDNVNSPMMKEWIGKVVDSEDLTRHDKWLCMMMPRLKLLRELLDADGVIFISIDDTEVHHMRILMDEVFGEQNYIATFTWKRRASSGLAQNLVSQDHDYIVCYGKVSFQGFKGNPKDYSAYSNPDNDPQGDWTLGDLYVQGWRKNKIYPDFVFTKSDESGKDYGKVFVIESKGIHLKDFDDTKYKRSVFKFCNEMGKKKEWKELNKEFSRGIEFQVIDEDEWRNRVSEMFEVYE